MKKEEEEINMKKILSIIVGLILISTITSCQNDKKIIENDLKNLIEFTRNGGYKSSNHDKMAAITFEAIDEGYKKMSYKINNTTEKNKDKILVNITMRYPDLSETAEMFKNRISKEAQSLSGKSDEEFNIRRKTKTFEITKSYCKVR